MGGGPSGLAGEGGLVRAEGARSVRQNDQILQDLQMYDASPTHFPKVVKCLSRKFRNSVARLALTEDFAPSPSLNRRDRRLVRGELLGVRHGRGQVIICVRRFDDSSG